MSLTVYEPANLQLEERLFRDPRLVSLLTAENQALRKAVQEMANVLSTVMSKSP